jgi:hypothetical protein
MTEFDYQPRKAERAYRMVALRKTILEERGQVCLGTNVRYFCKRSGTRVLPRCACPA